MEDSDSDFEDPIPRAKPKPALKAKPEQTLYGMFQEARERKLEEI